MRNFRTVAAGPARRARRPGAVVAGPTVASNAEQSKAQRVINEVPPAGHQVAYNAFRLKGKVGTRRLDGTLLPFQRQGDDDQEGVQAPASGRPSSKVKTNDKGVFKTRLFVPDKGRWKWRSRSRALQRFGNTKGKVWTLFFD